MKLNCPNCYSPLHVEGHNINKDAPAIDWQNESSLFTDIGKCRLLKFNVVESNRPDDVGMTQSEFECRVCKCVFSVKQVFNEFPEVKLKAA